MTILLLWSTILHCNTNVYYPGPVGEKSIDWMGSLKVQIIKSNVICITVSKLKISLDCGAMFLVPPVRLFYSTTHMHTFERALAHFIALSARIASNFGITKKIKNSTKSMRQRR